MAEKIGEARSVTTAALRALRKLMQRLNGVSVSDSNQAVDEGHGLADDQVAESGHVASPEELEALTGVLHSNRSLLLLHQIDAEDQELLAFGKEAAWRLVVIDADAALHANASNFKASFRRARALFELGQLEEALADATRVVDHYAQTVATPNPEAAALRESILEAVRKERTKWGQKSTTRWNRSTREQLVTEVSGISIGVDPVSTNESRNAKANATQELSVPWNAKPKPPSPVAVSQRLAAAPLKQPPAPKNGSDVEKALLNTLKGDASRQLTYVREHLSVSSVRRLYRRAPLGPDLLAELIRLLADLAQEDAAAAAELLRALAVAPSTKTHAAMFNIEEQSALQRLLALLGPDAAADWAPETAADGGA